MAASSSKSSKVQGHRSQVGRRPQGFTLIELLVSLSIITVITGQMLANFRSGQRLSELRFSTEIVMAQLREIQTNAVTGRLVGICSGGTNDGKVCEATKVPSLDCTGGSCDDRVPSGYGVRFSTVNPTEYVVFFDVDGDATYDPGEELNPKPYVSTGQVAFVGADASIPLDIVFTPPFGRVHVNGSPSGANSVEITLSHLNGSEERHVTINRITGKIEHD